MLASLNGSIACASEREHPLTGLTVSLSLFRYFFSIGRWSAIALNVALGLMFAQASTQICTYAIMYACVKWLNQE